MAKGNQEEKVRVNRILMIDDAIRSGAYPNADKLAEKAEVNRRTILRDIDYLRLMYKAPIEYDHQRRGFYYSEKNFFIKSIVLTEGELFSVALFDQLLEQYRNTPLEGRLRTIFDKILSSLPESLTLDSVFSPDQVSFIPETPVKIDSEVFEVIFTALKTRQTIRLEYRTVGSSSYEKRSLDPLHAICQRGHWYIIARRSDNAEIRIYSFSRIRNARLTGRNYTIPEDFKAHDYFDKEIGVFASNRIPYTFEFIIDKDIQNYALERQFHKTQKVRQLPDGSVRVQFTTTQIDEVQRWVMGQGAYVRVVNPPELIARIKDEITKMEKMY